MVGASSLNALHLDWCRALVPPRHRGSFPCSRIVPDSAGTTVIGNVTVTLNRILAHDAVVPVGVADDGWIYAHHCCVVCKSSAAPLSADKANSHISVAVVDSAVVSDLIPPVTVMEPVVTVVPAPPRRSPKRSLVRRRHPRTGNPIVAIIAPCPISGSPHPPFFRTWRLFINRQRRRSYRDAYLNACKRRNGNKQEHQSRQ